MIGMLTNLFLIGYALVCIAAGLVGIFLVEWEWSYFFRLRAASLPAEVMPDFLAHYRFMKGIELVFGLFILLYRRDILDGAQPWLIFLAGCLIGVLVRGSTWLIDGAPSPFFQLILASEIITLLLIVLYARRDRGSP